MAHSEGAVGAAAGVTRKASTVRSTRGSRRNAAAQLGSKQPSSAAQQSQGSTVEDNSKWADEMLQQLHSLPAASEGQEGLLQVKVRSHEDKDDKEGKLMLATPLEPAKHAVREYTAGYDDLVKTTIRNLGKQAVTLTPVYICVKPAGTDEEVDEQVTLESGEEAEYRLRLDESTGETEQGLMFRDAAGGVVLHVRILPSA